MYSCERRQWNNLAGGTRSCQKHSRQQLQNNFEEMSHWRGRFFGELDELRFDTTSIYHFGGFRAEILESWIIKRLLSHPWFHRGAVLKNDLNFFSMNHLKYAPFCVVSWRCKTRAGNGKFIRFRSIYCRINFNILTCAESAPQKYFDESLWQWVKFYVGSLKQTSKFIQ